MTDLETLLLIIVMLLQFFRLLYMFSICLSLLRKLGLKLFLRNAREQEIGKRDYYNGMADQSLACCIHLLLCLVHVPLKKS